MNRKAFTLIEFLIVLAIIALISVFIMVSLRSGRARARDVRRLQEMGQVVKALQLFWVDYDSYPTSTCPCSQGDWETSDKSPDDFMEYLAPYLSEVPLDPINTRPQQTKKFGPRPNEYFYAYQSYETADYCLCDDTSPTCVNVEGPFVVLGLRNLENYVSPDLPEKNMPLPLDIDMSRAVCGDPGPDGICTVEEYEDLGRCRDWSQELDYSVMLKD